MNACTSICSVVESFIPYVDCALENFVEITAERGLAVMPCLGVVNDMRPHGYGASDTRICVSNTLSAPVYIPKNLRSLFPVYVLIIQDCAGISVSLCSLLGTDSRH